MRPGEWTLRSLRVVTPTGTRAADVLVRGETIDGFRPHEDPEAEGVILDVGDLMVLPGLVDLHVHVQEPSRVEAEGFETATRAAAAGGITTLVDLPSQNWPVTTDARTLGSKLATSSGKLWVDVGFLGGLVEGSFPDLDSLLEAGVLGILTVLAPSSSADFPPATSADYRRGLPKIHRAGRPLLTIEGDPGRPGFSNPKLLARNQAITDQTVESIRGLITSCRESRCRVHLMGFSTVEALPWLVEARAEGLPITVGTCPHLLVFDSRRETLWEGLRSGAIDSIGSGHRPVPSDPRASSFSKERTDPIHIASLQTALSAVWTEARARGFSEADLVRWMAVRPSEIVGLATRKGSIIAGADADFVIFDAEGSSVVDPNHLFHRHPETPYEGRTLAGQVLATFLRGRMVFESGRFHEEAQGISILKLEETLPLLQGLDQLNEQPQTEAARSLQSCCGSSRWIAELLKLRPFVNESDLLGAADQVWARLGPEDMAEAIAAEPRVSDRFNLPESPVDMMIGSAGVTSFEISTEAIHQSLSEFVKAYEARFEHRFVGGDPDMHALDYIGLIEQRMANDPETELQVNSTELTRIVRRRLQSLIV